MPKRMYVGNLPYSFTSVDLEKLFSAHGKVRSAEVMSDRTTGQSRGFGFVEMETDEATQEAISKLDGSDCQGRSLKVNEARERAPRAAGFGGGGGGYGGGGFGGGRGGGGFGGGRGGGGGGRGGGGGGRGGRGSGAGERRDRGDRRDRGGSGGRED